MMRSALERVAGDAGVALSEEASRKAGTRREKRAEKADALASAPRANGNGPVAPA